jgi:hypothetical protein
VREDFRHQRFDRSPDGCDRRHQATAIAACQSCPVRLDCLLDALGFEACDSKAYGIRGGYTGAERIDLIRALEEVSLDDR